MNSTAAREDHGAIAERLAVLAEQLQHAAAELSETVSELRSQSKQEQEELQWGIDERNQHEQRDN